MFKRLITTMAVLAMCFSGVYAQSANNVKGSETTKKAVTANTAVKKEKVSQAKDSSASTALIASLTKDKDRQVRRNAARSLGDMKDAKSVKALVRQLNDADPAVRKAAYAALKNIGSPAVQPLTVALKHRNPLVRRQAATLIGKVSRGAPQVARTQNKDKESDSALHANATSAVAKVNKKQSETLD